jgi:hypothetical protein
LFAGLILYSLIPIYSIHGFQFILQWKKQLIPTKSNPTDSTKMASMDPDGGYKKHPPAQQGYAPRTPFPAAGHSHMPAQQKPISPT